MRAWRFDGHDLSLVDTPVPAVPPGGALVRVDAAGLCHSDVTLMGRPPETHPFSLPLVLGHEIAGTVIEVGAGAKGGHVRVGDPVVVYGPWGCGTCRPCLTGHENHCRSAREVGVLPPGLGADGGLAEVVAVPNVRHLVPTRGLHAAQAAPATDAGLTAYHAVRRVLPACAPGSVAVVVGVGGLGHVALQVLRELTSATVVALDVSADARWLAGELGAHMVIDPAADDALDAVRDLTEGSGAEVVLDFVANRHTLSTSVASLARGGQLALVGVSGDTLPVSISTMPLGATLHTPYWGSRQDLEDVLSLARAGRLTMRVEEIDMEEVTDAYDRLSAGEVVGRAVVRPQGRQS